MGLRNLCHEIGVPGAKSGALMGTVCNEAGAVTFPDGAGYAVAVFTRRTPGTATVPSLIDARIARAFTDQLRPTRS